MPTSDPAALDNPQRQSHRACQELVRYVYQRNLKPGDRLPPQETLRTTLAFSHDTLSRAMRSLVSYGMVRRQVRLGTVIADPAAVIPDLWTVALPIYSHTEQADNLFIATLLRFLQGRLADAGCRSRTYARRVDSGPDPTPLSDFPGLEADVAAGRVDIVLSPTHLSAHDTAKLRKQGVPVCRVGIHEEVDCGVVIDFRPLASQAVPMLADAGCRRVQLVTMELFWRDALREVRMAFTAAARASSLALGVLSVEGSARVAAGRAVGRRLLDLPDDQRPDGLIVLTDTLAIGLAQVIGPSSYRPRLIVAANRQAPMAFTLPLRRFELDVDNLAAEAVAMTLRRLRHPDLSDERRWVALQLAPEEADGDTTAQLDLLPKVKEQTL